MKTQVELPDRRLDVIESLKVLASDVSRLDSGRDTRWPDLTNAVHWLVDDTVWDHYDPAESIGVLLRSEAEAAAIRLVVASVVIVSETVGADISDRSWFESDEWPRVQELSRSALLLMELDRD